MAFWRWTQFTLLALVFISPSTLLLTSYFKLHRLLTSLAASQQQLSLAYHPCLLHEGRHRVDGDSGSGGDGGPKIFMITPTYPRPERLADVTRLAQSLALARHLYHTSLEWIVVEDGERTKPAVERILQRSGLAYHYLTAETPSAYRVWSLSGNTQRNRGIDFLRGWRNQAGSDRRRAVVYFGDDDNTYDHRLFDAYIARVERIGVWGVGLAGGVAVVGPHVDAQGVVTGWDGDYRRTFDDHLLDISGFAVDLDYLLERNATFHYGCAIPEPCFLRQLNFTQQDVQAFGYAGDPRELLVWHTKTVRNENIAEFSED